MLPASAIMALASPMQGELRMVNMIIGPCFPEPASRRFCFISVPVLPYNNMFKRTS